jgi:hypothetical protein
MKKITIFLLFCISITLANSVLAKPKRIKRWNESSYLGEINENKNNQERVKQIYLEYILAYL